MKQYKFKSMYAEFDKKAVSAQVVGSELVKMQKTKKLTPESLVKRASRETHPLHDCFNWDDTEAANKYRVVQARSMLRISVEITPYSDEVRTFTNVRTDEGYEYVPTIALLQTKDGREFILQRMQNEINVLTRRYATYSYLSDYCAQLEAFNKNMVLPDKQVESTTVQQQLS